MMSDEMINKIILALNQIEKDFSVPKNVRLKVKNATMALVEENNKGIAVKVDKSIQELDELSDDPNIPSYTRTQIWNIMSLLEGV